VVTEPRVRFRKETGLSDQGDRTASDPQRTFAGPPLTAWTGRELPVCCRGASAVKGTMTVDNCVPSYRPEADIRVAWQQLQAHADRSS
jgi:hypothetical protein